MQRKFRFASVVCADPGHRDVGCVRTGGCPSAPAAATEAATEATDRGCHAQAADRGATEAATEAPLLPPKAHTTSASCRRP